MEGQPRGGEVSPSSISSPLSPCYFTDSIQVHICSYQSIAAPDKRNEDSRPVLNHFRPRQRPRGLDPGLTRSARRRRQLVGLRRES